MRPILIVIFTTQEGQQLLVTFDKEKAAGSQKGQGFGRKLDAKYLKERLSTAYYKGK